MTQLLILLGSFIATTVGSMAGGGSGLILTPIWIMLGYPLPVAVATQQLSGIFWAPLASHQYLKDTPLDRKLTLCLLIPGLVGAYFGARTLVDLDPAIVRRVIGFCLFTLVIVILMKKTFGVVSSSPRAPRAAFVPLSFGLGFYEGFFGSGNGIFSSSLLVALRGFTLPVALGHYYFLATSWCALSASYFIMSGYYDLSLMLPAIAGCMFGGYTGAKIGKGRGPKFVRIAFLAIGAVLSVALIFKS